MHDVVIGQGAVVRNAIIDKNVRCRRAPRSASTRCSTSRASPCRPTGSSSSGRGRRSPRRSLDRHRRCASPCSPASTRPRSTAAPASTSSTSSEHLAGLVDLDVLCFGAPRESPLVKAAYEPWEAIGSGRPHDAVLRTLSVDLLMAAGVGGRRPRPHPHLVRQLRRPPGPAPLRHPPRGHHPQPRAAPPLEGGTARRRLRRVVVLRADGARGGRRRHRRVGRRCATTSSTPTRPSTPTGSW